MLVRFSVQKKLNAIVILFINQYKIILWTVSNLQQ